MTDDVLICSATAPKADDGSARTFDPAWRSETVLLLAKAIEAEQALDRMPILADALQEAGCEDEVLLRHCRECEWHEPGCWVIGKALNRPEPPPLPLPVVSAVTLPQPNEPFERPVANRGNGRSLPLVGCLVAAFGLLKLLAFVGHQSNSTETIRPPVSNTFRSTVPSNRPSLPEMGILRHNTYTEDVERFRNAFAEYERMAPANSADPHFRALKYRELDELAKRIKAAQATAEADRERQQKWADLLLTPETPTPGSKPK